MNKQNNQSVINGCDKCGKEIGVFRHTRVDVTFINAFDVKHETYHTACYMTLRRQSN